ncbi:MAG TPA: alpha/beta hydrolase [Candidatus Kryptonia bacterium]
MTKVFLFVVSFFLFHNVQCQALDTTIEHNDAKIHFKTVGEGRPILLLAGGPGLSFDYLVPVAQGLAKSFRCILVDERGTGKSAVQTYDTTTITVSLTIEDLEYLRNYLGYKDWFVLGSSVGGYVASSYACAYPKSVSALVLVGSAGFNSSLWAYYGANIWCRLLPSDQQLSESWSDSAVVAKDPRHAGMEYLKAILPAFFYDRLNCVRWMPYMKDEWYNLDVANLISHDMAKDDITEKSRAYKNPVLVLQGRQDQVGESMPYIISQTYPNSKLVFINKCGHLPWLEQPKIFYDAVETFLSEKK